LASDCTWHLSDYIGPTVHGQAANDGMPWNIGLPECH